MIACRSVGLSGEAVEKDVRAKAGECSVFDVGEAWSFMASSLTDDLGDSGPLWPDDDCLLVCDFDRPSCRSR